jgi:hypothetical protein
MEIHILDWLLYFVFLYIIYRILGEQYTDGIGALVGFIVLLIYTMSYCIIFYFIDWVDIFNHIKISL